MVEHEPYNPGDWSYSLFRAIRGCVITACLAALALVIVAAWLAGR